MSFTITGNATDLDLDTANLPTVTAQVLAPWTAEDGTLRTSHATGRFDETGALVKDEFSAWVIGAPEGVPMYVKAFGLPPLRFLAPADGTTVDLADLYAEHSPQPAPAPTTSYVRGASAYEVAVAAGFTGTEAEWLTSLEANEVSDAAMLEIVNNPSTQTGSALDAAYGAYSVVRLMEFIAPADRAGAVAGAFPVDAAFAAALASLPVITDPQDHDGGHPRGKIILPGGQLRVDAPLPALGPFVSVEGQGKWATLLMFHGSGVAMHCHSPHYPDTGGLGFMSLDWAGDLTDFGIDGTNAGIGSTGLSYGDLEGGEVNVLVQNFDKADCIGAHIVNEVWWTEKTHARVVAKNNTEAVVFEVAASANPRYSFGYNNFFIELFATPGQNGVVFRNGPNYYHGTLAIWGNMQVEEGVPATDTAMLTLEGVVPPGSELSGRPSAISNCVLNAQLERNGTGSSHPRSVILRDGTSVTAQGLLAVSDLDPADFSGGTFRFQGLHWGEPSLPGAINDSGVAVGVGASTSGQRSVAVGRDASAYQDSVAIGWQATSSADRAVLIGSGTAAGSQGTAVGVNATVGSGVAIGYSSSAPAVNTTAVGRNADATGNQATAVGNGSTAAAANSVAIGHNATATNGFATALGVGVSTTNWYQVAIGNRHLEALEMDSATVGTPSADAARLYVADDGAGKTQLVVRFSDGADHVLAVMA